ELLGEHAPEIVPVARLFVLARERLELRGVDEAGAPGDFFGAGDLQALAALDGLDEVRGFQQRLVRARVEPGHAALHRHDLELAALEVRSVDIRDLALAARRGLEA